MEAAGEYVGARQQAGIVVHTEEVQQCRQDVRRRAVFVYHDVLRKTGDIADKTVAVLFKGRVQRLPCQLVVLVFGQAVGVVVVGQDDAGLVGNASLLQPLHQVLQCVFQLQIAGNVRLHRLRIGQIFHRVAVFGAHGVVPVVLVVTAEGHVIGVEGFSAVDVVIYGGLHHLQVGGWPVDLHGQTRIRRLERVAHVGVGDVPVVEIPDVVVIAPGLIAHALERIAQAERQIVGARHIEAGIRLRAGHIRIKPHAHGAFAVGGDGLERAVVIFKENTRMAQLVERRRQLLADKPRAEALGADGDEVIVLKKSCVVVFAGGCCI